VFLVGLQGSWACGGVRRQVDLIGGVQRREAQHAQCLAVLGQQWEKVFILGMFFSIFFRGVIIIFVGFVAAISRSQGRSPNRDGILLKSWDFCQRFRLVSRSNEWIRSFLLWFSIRGGEEGLSGKGVPTAKEELKVHLERTTTPRAKAHARVELLRLWKRCYHFVAIVQILPCSTIDGQTVAARSKFIRQRAMLVRQYRWIVCSMCYLAANFTS